MYFKKVYFYCIFVLSFKLTIMKQLIFILTIFCFQIQQLQAQCTDDCVWPGDLNANGIANHMDLLALGLAFGETGPTRIDTNTDWAAKDADDWANDLPVLGSNHKHIDANGDGFIDEFDQFPIGNNFNLTNSNFSGLLGNNLEGNDLFVVAQNSVASPGGSLIFDIHLGTAANPISGIYGIGFQVEFDALNVEDVLLDFSDSWIGTPDEMLSFDKYTIGVDDVASVAMTRFDGNTVSGFGKIAQMEIVIEDVILGLEVDSTACIPFPITFSQVLGIDNNEVDQMITFKSDSAMLKHPSQIVSTTEIPKESLDFQLYPNPAKEMLHIQTLKKPIDNLFIINSFGQTVFQQSFLPNENQPTQLDISIQSLPRGCYYVVLQTVAGISTKKILLE